MAHCCHINTTSATAISCKAQPAIRSLQQKIPGDPPTPYSSPMRSDKGIIISPHFNGTLKHGYPAANMPMWPAARILYSFMHESKSAPWSVCYERTGYRKASKSCRYSCLIKAIVSESRSATPNFLDCARLMCISCQVLFIPYLQDHQSVEIGKGWVLSNPFKRFPARKKCVCPASGRVGREYLAPVREISAAQLNDSTNMFLVLLWEHVVEVSWKVF